MKQDEKEHKISLSIPAGGYRRRMVFNRYAIEKIGEHILVSFGLIDDTGSLRDVFCCALTKQTLADNRANIMTFIGRVGVPVGKPPKWSSPGAMSGKIEAASLINVGISIDGELLLSAIALGPALTRAKKGETVDADPIAQLRCEPDLLKWLLLELYPSNQK